MSAANSTTKSKTSKAKAPKSVTPDPFGFRFMHIESYAIQCGCLPGDGYRYKIKGREIMRKARKVNADTNVWEPVHQLPSHLDAVEIDYHTEVPYDGPFEKPFVDWYIGSNEDIAKLREVIDEMNAATIRMIEMVGISG